MFTAILHSIDFVLHCGFSCVSAYCAAMLLSRFV